MAGALDNGSRTIWDAGGAVAPPTPSRAPKALDSARRPHRWNAYAYVENSPLNLVDPEGLDAILLNFTGMVGPFGHEGIVVVMPNGAAEFASFGPIDAGWPLDFGQVSVYPLLSIQFAPDGLPTAASLKTLARELAIDEHQAANSIRMNYFATTAKESAALKRYIAQQEAAADKGELFYNAISCNCANFALQGLKVAGKLPPGYFGYS